MRISKLNRLFRLPHTFLVTFNGSFFQKFFNPERYSAIFACRGDVTIALEIRSSSAFPSLNDSPAAITLMMILPTYRRQARWPTVSVLCCLHTQPCVHHSTVHVSAAMSHKAGRMFLIDFRISYWCC